MSELVPQWMSRFSPFYALVPVGGGELTIGKGVPASISIQLENRQGGRKHITHVLNLELFGIDPEDLAADARQLFACSATTQACPGKNNKNLEVLIQGDAVDGLVAHLGTQFGIPRSLISCA